MLALSQKFAGGQRGRSSTQLIFRSEAKRKADLEVVAQAALHWVSGLRSAAIAIEPTALIRVELMDANDGSLSLNTVLTWAEGQLEQIQRGAKKYPRLAAIAVALALFAGEHVGGH